jgi:uncharacterized membrane protein
MKNRSPWSVLVAELSYFLTVMAALIAGYVFWKGNVLSKVDKGSEYGVYQVLPFLGLIEIGMVVVFLFTLRRILVKSGILTKEESFRYLRSRTWYMDN